MYQTHIQFYSLFILATNIWHYHQKNVKGRIHETNKFRDIYPTLTKLFPRNLRNFAYSVPFP